MGTRNLTCVVVDKKMAVAQYCQWDGYLEGQGAEVASFLDELTANGELAAFKDAVRSCRYVDEKTISKLWKDAGADAKGLISFKNAEKLEKKLPAFSRNTGAGILQLIMSGKVRELQDSRSFAADSLFCEFAYVLDLDREQLEIYYGFNKGKAKGRFARLKPSDKEGRYGAITLKHVIPFGQVAKALDVIVAEEKAREEE